ncbi:MAG TPA: RHS repeat-associated core domain-containing protein, partial [Phycisphaerae bacterium]|nr:RHS repeat-associated core domain-containing protein [Phycisphaerae bacterium]
CEDSDPECAAYTLAREFIWGARFPEPVAMVDHVGAMVPVGTNGPSWTYHYVHDALGSVVGLTGASGEVVERYTYDPYGKTHIEFGGGGGGTWQALEVAPGGPCFSGFRNPFMWTGQRYDASLELYHFLYRSYSPDLGRWLQQDPIGYEGGFNLYEYVRSSPMRWIDPLGLDGRDQGWNDDSADLDAAINDAGNKTHLSDAGNRISTDAANLFIAATEPETAVLVATTLTPIPGDEIAVAIVIGAKAAKALKLADKAKKVLGKVKKSSAKLRKEWSEKHGKPWPKDKKGNNQDVHHKKPEADGGTDDVDNVEPKTRKKHVEHHKKKGDFKRWGKRAKKKKAEKDKKGCDDKK